MTKKEMTMKLIGQTKKTKTNDERQTDNEGQKIIGRKWMDNEAKQCGRKANESQWQWWNNDQNNERTMRRNSVWQTGRQLMKKVVCGQWTDSGQLNQTDESQTMDRKDRQWLDRQTEEDWPTNGEEGQWQTDSDPVTQWPDSDRTDPGNWRTQNDPAQ